MFTKDISSTFDKNLKNEWLVTNGIGGYASSTIIGVNTRKYHGLLIASLGNSINRVLALSKFNEYIKVEGNRYSISSNECQNYIEKGYIYEEAFERKKLPEFLYSVSGIEIVKKIAMSYGENKVCIKYNIVNTNSEVAYFSLVPFVNFRNIHTVSNAQEYPYVFGDDEILRVDVEKKYRLYIKVDDASFTAYDNTFYNNMYYRVERERGFEAEENLFMPGEFKVEIEAESQKEIYVVAELNTECTIDDKDTKNIIRGEEIRLEKLCKMAAIKDDAVKKELVFAADQFIVSKGHDKSIIAGYPWFQDWGRDVFISLEGLTLKTNRFQDAKAILKYFANYIRRGLIPNFINENGGGSYNTVDASLWYIEAVNKFIEYTNDLSTLKELFPKVLEIVFSYMVGTDFDIYMDEDGLISAGNKDTQLTWMDAKVGDYVPTPRFGKAVEINALWYNALKVVESLNKRLIKKYVDNYSEKMSSKDIIYSIYNIDVEDISEKFVESKTRDIFLSDEVINYYDSLAIVFDGRLSEKVKESYKKFYADNGLYDTISPYSDQIRPNQIISLSLSYPVVSGDKAKEIFKLVEEKLFTEKGLKTLSSEDKDYKGRYEGDSYNRDISYHQGTVWPWLIGEYAKAYKYVFNKKFMILKASELLNDGCVGNIAEIYDADEPRYANGALAQAWSVAAVIKIVL